jgi:curli biogenesis system outer membrane secretion channel CsgG
MIKLLSVIFLTLFLAINSFAQNKTTIAVESFRFSPINPSTANFMSRFNYADVKNLGDVFSATFTEKLRKAGYTVVSRKNIDSLMDENRLGQIGLSDDEGTTKLRSADLRVIGTIKQFEESEKSNGTIGIIGAVAGKKVTQMQGICEIVVEVIARDGTVIASSSGKSTKYGRVNDTTILGGAVNNKIFGIVTNSNTGAFSDAITSASTNSIEVAVKDLATQLKKLDLQSYAKDSKPEIINNLPGPNLNKTRIVVSFPESQVVEEVFIEALSNANAKVVLGSSFDRSIINNKEAFANYSNNLRKNSGNAKYLVFGTIDQDRVDNQAVRISMSIRVFDLNAMQFIHSDSAQGSVNDVSLKAGYDRVCKQVASKLVAESLVRINKQMNNADVNLVYTLEMSGFQSLSSANRYLKLLKDNPNVISTEVIDFQNQTLYAEIKFNDASDLSSVLEKDNKIIEMFSVVVQRINNNKIQASVIVR